ncbi:MAG: hypothetical protein P9M14_07375 [Candidatus Alcyoniella australis]|nr:hypothetical protein [Candidatus Alcyoniella australis]
MVLFIKILLSALIVVLLAIAVIKSIAGFVKLSMAARIAQKFQQQEVLMHDVQANFIGLESKGEQQTRGNGALLLTERELWFLRAKPKLELSIPMNNIKDFGLKKYHAGTSLGVPLLYVHFITETGEETVAWSVRKAEDWINSLESATGRPSDQSLQLPAI